MVGAFERGNKPSGSIKGGKVSDVLSDSLTSEEGLCAM